jgi:hypothetical protein
MVTQYPIAFIAFMWLADFNDNILRGLSCNGMGSDGFVPFCMCTERKRKKIKALVQSTNKFTAVQRSHLHVFLCALESGIRGASPQTAKHGYESPAQYGPHTFVTSFTFHQRY